jgi:5-methylcytosine-specific restriction enzyme subunit McrC
MKRVVVREYARLTSSKLDQNTLDQAQISESAFEWLCDLAGSFRSSGASLLQIDGRRLLKLDSYVGVLESPCGQVIEILPKHHQGDDCETSARQLLCKLIESALDMNSRSTTEAGLEIYKTSLSEWVMRQFLLALDHLLKRGMRFDYQRIEEEQRFLRGQLDVVKQMRLPPGRQHLFNIRHDVFLPDRPENRLLQSALKLVCKSAKDAENWRLSHKLAGILQELPKSDDVEKDFRLWRNDRLMAHYQPLRPWCELILHQHMPKAVAGAFRGISLLFPMEKLFESYVEKQLRSALPVGAWLQKQPRTKYLCSHSDEFIFRLEPDLFLNLNGEKIILDTKWKLLDASDRKNKYGISQADMYQLFAYGHKYLHGKGQLILLYPSYEKFNKDKAISDFKFGNDLRLSVLPFDLDDHAAAKNLVQQLHN